MCLRKHEHLHESLNMSIFNPLPAQISLLHIYNYTDLLIFSHLVKSWQAFSFYKSS